jgi:hypothetical protein
MSQPLPESDPALERRNLQWGLALFGLSLLLFGGTFLIGLAYLWLS